MFYDTRRITIRRKERNQKFDEAIIQPGALLPTEDYFRQIASKLVKKSVPARELKPTLPIRTELKCFLRVFSKLC